QSLAILEYLDETKPGHKLLPADPLGRARVRSLSQLVACDIHPINNLRILNYLKSAMAQPQETVDLWYRHWCDQGLTALEAELTDQRTGLFCHGDTVTMADLCLVPQVFNAQRFKVDMDRYPHVMRIFSGCMSMEAFAKAQPSAQPEASRAS
ncbi:MAG: maleylacetoacetate isomerase, partial [Quisquiliibacterium sp.]